MGFNTQSNVLPILLKRCYKIHKKNWRISSRATSLEKIIPNVCPRYLRREQHKTIWTILRKCQSNVVMLLRQYVEVLQSTFARATRSDVRHQRYLRY